jgi:hypothetical protein
MKTIIIFLTFYSSFFAEIIIQKTASPFSRQITVLAERENLYLILHKILSRGAIDFQLDESLKMRHSSVQIIDKSLKEALLQLVKQENLQLLYNKKQKLLSIQPKPEITNPLNSLKGKATIKFEKTRVDLALNALFQSAGLNCIIHDGLSNLTISGSFTDTEIAEIITVIAEIHKLRIVFSGGIYAVFPPEKN